MFRSSEIAPEASKTQECRWFQLSLTKSTWIEKPLQETLGGLFCGLAKPQNDLAKGFEPVATFGRGGEKSEKGRRATYQRETRRGYRRPHVLVSSRTSPIEDA